MKTELFKNEKIRLYFWATVIFAAFASLIFREKIFTNQTFIGDGDALSQHYKAFIYYGRYLRSIFYNLFIDRKFLLPQFDIAIGEGSDILHSLCYYVIGDPFAFISVFFPDDKSYIGFGLSGILRLYAAFLSFACMCNYFGKKNIPAVLAGCVCYCFVPATLSIEGQIFFINPYVFLPLLIVGVNKIMCSEKPFLYIVAVFFSSLSNFYFFYMLVLILIFYVAVKSIFGQKMRINEIFMLAIKCVLYALLSFLLASFLLLPVIHVYIHDPRNSAINIHLLYDLKDYIKLPLSFAARVTVESMLAIFILFAAKKRNDVSGILKIFVVSCFLVLIFPFLCQVLNALSYPENRWAFALTLLVSYITVFSFDSFKKIEFWKGAVFLLLWGLYCVFVGCFSDGKWPLSYARIQIPVGVFFLVFEKDFFVLNGRIPLRIKNNLRFLLICFTVFLLNGQREGISAERAKKILTDNSGERAKIVADSENFSDFFRVAKTGIQKENDDVNVNMISGISGTEYYWSLMNGDVLDFRKSLEICDQRHDFWYTGYDVRPALTDLACVRYTFIDDSQHFPTMFGYSATSDKNILRNENFIPFGYVYENYVLREDFEKLNAAEKEAVLAKAIVVENPSLRARNLTDFDFGVKNLSFVPEFNESEIEFEGNRIVAKKNNAVITLKFSSDSGSNVYLRMTGMDYHKDDGKEPQWETFIIRADNGYVKNFDLELPRYKYYSGKTSTCVNLGYCDETSRINAVSITLDDEGEYEFSDFGLLSLPTKQLCGELKNLSESHFENVVFETNKISGHIKMKKDGILCIPIPYLEGWSAIVDGKDSPVLKGNIMYMALELSCGQHEITLLYRTPFF